MKGYLFDTNICIYYMNGKYNLQEKFLNIKPKSRFISEITLAELKYGVHNSNHPYENNQTLNNFLSGVQVLPIFNSLDKYAEEKARLKKEGQIIDEFDLLIGCSAVTNNLIMVTNNEFHLNRIQGIKIQNWTI